MKKNKLCSVVEILMHSMQEDNVMQALNDFIPGNQKLKEKVAKKAADLMMKDINIELKKPSKKNTC